MRSSFLAATALISMGMAAGAFAATADDAAYDANNKPVVDSRGNCVRTMWQGANDPCAAAAAPAPMKREHHTRVTPPQRKAAPVSSNEQSTIYFDFNKATLTAASKQKLDALAATINASSSINNVTIHGFTDQLGTEAYNSALAEKRVAVVKEYLDSKARLKAEGDIKGLGKASPEAGCAAKKARAAKITCMAKERRVEVEFNAEK